MKGFFKKAKAELENRLDSHSKSSHSSSQSGPDQPSDIKDPTPLDILRYRYHHGTNLGSVYVVERWLHPSRFPDGAQGSSELESVKAWVEQIGIDETRKKFEQRWADAVSDEDIKWLQEQAKCTTIRLPIGYYDLDPSLSKGTPFEPYIAVYSNAWSSISNLVSRLRAHSIGVLLDIHALPGGANPQEHSGTNIGTTELWTSHSNRKLGIKCCEFIANEVSKGLEVVGIQIVNEAEWESKRMYDWYDDCIDAISSIDATVPVVISDGWDLSKAVEYSLKKNAAYPSKPICPIIIDTHYYWAFSDADKKKTPQQIISEVNTKLKPLDGKEGSIIDRGAVQVIVGEYSCVLTEDSWAKSGDTSKQELVEQFGQNQSKRYQSRSGGAFFWTWKMDWYPGGEWGFAEQTNHGAIVPPPYQSIPPSDIPQVIQRANQDRDDRMYAAVNSHVSYWQRHAPNMRGEHWRFEAGYKVGYQDALAFFEGKGEQNIASGNKIGNLEIWILKRIRESGHRGGFVWEFEQGLRKGIQDFQGIVGL